MARVFELHFNPNKSKKQKVIFDTFCFAPEPGLEKGLGSLYLVGEIKNILPFNQGLLAELAEAIKNGYYHTLEGSSAEDRLRQALQKANELLYQELSQENTTWLGNLNLAAVTVTADLTINLSKVGNIKILVFTQGEAFDIGGDVDASSIRTFPNMIEGKLADGDKILVLTRDVFQSFNQQGLIRDLAEIEKPKEIKKVLKGKKKILRELFGAGLLIFAKKQKGYLNLPTHNPVNPRTKQGLAAGGDKLDEISPCCGVGAQSPPSKTELIKGLLSLLILAILLLLGSLIF